MMRTRKSSTARTTLTITDQPITVPVIAGLIIVLLIVVIDMAGPLLAIPLTMDSNNSGIEFKRYCNHSLSDLLILICGNTLHSGFPREPDIGEYSSLGSVNEANSNKQLSYCCRNPCGYSQLILFCS